MRKMMQLKRRAALVLSAAMVVSAPSLQTFAKQLNTDVSSTAKANDVRVATSGDADPATGGDAKPAAKEKRTRGAVCFRPMGRSLEGHCLRPVHRSEFQFQCAGG